MFVQPAAAEDLADIEEMREEVDEARRLAEEWELKYKEMQRQMSELEGGYTAKKTSGDELDLRVGKIRLCITGLFKDMRLNPDW